MYAHMVGSSAVGTLILVNQQNRIFIRCTRNYRVMLRPRVFVEVSGEEY